MKLVRIISTGQKSIFLISPVYWSYRSFKLGGLVVVVPKGEIIALGIHLQIHHFCTWPFCYLTTNMHWILTFDTWLQMCTDYKYFDWLGSVTKREVITYVKNTDELCLSQAKLPKIKANRSFPKCNIYWNAHPRLWACTQIMMTQEGMECKMRDM